MVSGEFDADDADDNDDGGGDIVDFMGVPISPPAPAPASTPEPWIENLELGFVVLI